jgi:hypothetical protein
VQHDSVSTRIKIFGTFTNLQIGKSKLSFYNPGSFSISDCTLGNIDEGIFHHFIKNPLRKNHVCHEEIPFKHIKEIRLKIHGNAYNKKYTVR